MGQLIYGIPGHSCPLHSHVMLEWPLQTPPLSSLIDLIRVPTRVPLPHDEEHGPKFQSDQTQSATKYLVRRKIQSYVLLSQLMWHGNKLTLETTYYKYCMKLGSNPSQVQ